MSELDLEIIVPVYNEGENIVSLLESLEKSVRSKFRVLICYDRDDDATLPAIRAWRKTPYEIEFVKNEGAGALGAVMTGLRRNKAPAALVMPADDGYNAIAIDPMVKKFRDGAQIVSASRFIPGGCIVGCPIVKATLVRVASFMLYHFAGVPSHDATNGFRLFSRRVIEAIKIESTVGFAYSIEYLVKCHRIGWKISEVPAVWYERTKGKSRFQVSHWLPQYLSWFVYAFQTKAFAALLHKKHGIMEAYEKE